MAHQRRVAAMSPEAQLQSARGESDHWVEHNRSPAAKKTKEFWA